MRKTAILALVIIVIIAVTTGFVLSRSARAMSIKVHKKDLPEHGLIIIGPSDPSFDALLAGHLKGEPNEVLDNLKPFSFFVENRSKQTVVAYTLEWCFTKPDGTNDCYRQSVVNPRPLMDGGGDLPEVMVEQSGRIKPASSRFFSLIAADGSGGFRVPVSPEEAEQFKRGLKPDRWALLQRYGAELSKYSDITFSLDGAFFDDGTFIGPNTTGLFEQTMAQINAKRDLLNEITHSLSKAGKSKDAVFRELEDTTKQPKVSLDSKSTPEDHYKYHRRFYAAEILRSRGVLGDEKALATALRPMKKQWRVLQKKKS
jgi:hypothetical protein